MKGWGDDTTTILPFRTRTKTKKPKSLITNKGAPKPGEQSRSQPWMQVLIIRRFRNMFRTGKEMLSDNKDH